MTKNRDIYIRMLMFIIDIICLIAAFLIASYVWIDLYLGRFIVWANNYTFLVAYLIVVLLFNSSQYFLQRANIEELMSICKTTIIVGAFAVGLLFFTKNADDFSRGAFLITCVLDIIFDYIARCQLKTYLKKKNSEWMPRMLLVAEKREAEKVIHTLNDGTDMNPIVDQVILTDVDEVGKTIGNVPVVANCSTMLSYMKKQVVDDVFIYTENPREQWISKMIEELEKMGIVVHLNMGITPEMEQFNKRVELLGAYPVVSFATNFFDGEKMMLKRLMDIIGSLIGCAITLVVTVFLAPFLLIESPGSLFFKQKRVGRNGRYFYIYKFRSMYMDAEQRKKDLMEKNEMKGLMFKMKDDPRVTKVGKFIRATSIDELPQFFNVLKGDMSLVGTRPPTVDEFKQYKGYHKRRLSIKPGITGMWQVSGRSDIEDFEEVVRLDLKYIDNWSLSLDIKIILKTCIAVFQRAGAR
ncbi:MAG: sugar transferase [Clostridiales bacterium]|nr:sugar transferase [Clostridiales bacterium]